VTILRDEKAVIVLFFVLRLAPLFGIHGILFSKETASSRGGLIVQGLKLDAHVHACWLG
jgi:hypothetical protein